jgi:hypothetical protein
VLESGGVIRAVLGDIPQAYLMGREEPGRIGDLVASRAAAPRDRPSEPGQGVQRYSRREIARRFASVLDAAAKPRAGAARDVNDELVRV